MSQKRKAAETETGTARKGRKGKAAAAAADDDDDDEIIVAEKKPKASRNNKAQVCEDDGEPVKEENDEDAGVHF
jgi:hypothetical protein